jgi:hypothetical protein
MKVDSSGIDIRSNGTEGNEEEHRCPHRRPHTSGQKRVEMDLKFDTLQVMPSTPFSTYRKRNIPFLVPKRLE